MLCLQWMKGEAWVMLLLLSKELSSSHDFWLSFHLPKRWCEACPSFLLPKNWDLSIILEIGRLCAGHICTPGSWTSGSKHLSCRWMVKDTGGAHFDFFANIYTLSLDVYDIYNYCYILIKLVLWLLKFKHKCTVCSLKWHNKEGGMICF